MASINTIVRVASLPLAREILGHVARNRIIRIGELLKLQSMTVDNSRTQALEAIRDLKEMKLIEEKGAPIEDYSTLYVTADGIEVSRKAGQFTS